MLTCEFCPAYPCYKYAIDCRLLGHFHSTTSLFFSSSFQASSESYRKLLDNYFTSKIPRGLRKLTSFSTIIVYLTAFHHAPVDVSVGYDIRRLSVSNSTYSYSFFFVFRICAFFFGFFFFKAMHYGYWSDAGILHIICIHLQDLWQLLWLFSVGPWPAFQRFLCHVYYKFVVNVLGRRSARLVKSR